MKIVIAPDSFKGSLTAQEAAQAIRTGVLDAIPDAECVIVPMADGGEGTVRSLVDATGGTLVTTSVTGPLGRPVSAHYGLLGDSHTAVIEMSAASGIQYVNAATRDPLTTTTYGTGELILDALDRGVDALIVGLGGSATNDGGAGMAQALGVSLRDADGRELDRGGAALQALDRIDVTRLDPRLHHCTITLASDVTNPLVGPEGSSHVFGPQKGATPAMVERLDAALAHYADVIHDQLDRDVAHTPGAGAAGGLGAGFLAFTRATMSSGVGVVVEATRLREQARGADYCITGEGGIDAQTRFGKTPMGTAQAVKEVAPGCIVVALAGFIGEGIASLREVGIDAVLGILPGVCTLDEALDPARAKENLTRTACNVARLFRS
ncbi:glycerate kinase [Bifidobacterium mongoliense]|uniref:Glycerate kinase n=1 Tax=Bifidobacterium mongoliense TaxID=518643 RepID=A0A423UDF3_9BIFI|nr:glycerate kinase [Bifidobacterium mongoliense]ROT86711.1 glycerate kinase [Bifidobacterium mongoliense]